MERPNVAANKQVLFCPPWTPCWSSRQANALCARVKKPTLRPIAGEILEPSPYGEVRCIDFIVDEQCGSKVAGIAVQSYARVPGGPDILDLRDDRKVAGRE